MVLSQALEVDFTSQLLCLEQLTMLLRAKRKEKLKRKEGEVAGLFNFQQPGLASPVPAPNTVRGGDDFCIRPALLLWFSKAYHRQIRSTALLICAFLRSQAVVTHDQLW